MSLNRITEKVMQQVDDVTGLPVLVNADPSLKLIATSTIARGSAAAHLISFNPAVSASADYVICFQCGFILRTFSVPASERVDLQGTWRGRKDAEKLLADHLRGSKLSLPKETKAYLRDQMFDGLLRQLRSVPIGLRVDSWIALEYPELADQQRTIIGRQLNENMAALSPEIRRFAPAKVFNANLAMNSAFAAYWARAWSDPPLLSPYRAMGSPGSGDLLLKSFDEIPDVPTSDRILMATWGDQLGLSGWCEFAPFK